MNSAGAEMLYSCIGDTAALDEKSTLVDVCCGTGTIGLCLANRVKEVPWQRTRAIELHVIPMYLPIHQSSVQCIYFLFLFYYCSVGEYVI